MAGDPRVYRGTVASHGLRWRFNGMPIFDEDGNVIGYYAEPQWHRSEMTEAQLVELDEAIAEFRRELMRRSDQDTSYWTSARIYAGVGEWDGVACDHPEQWRKAWFRTAWECEGCGVVTEVEPEPKPTEYVAYLVDGPFGGERMKVKPGQLTVLRCVKVDLSPSMPLDPMASFPIVEPMRVAEYRFTGRHHENDWRILEFSHHRTA